MEEKSDARYEEHQKYSFKVGSIINVQRPVDTLGSLLINQGQMTLRQSNDLYEQLEIDLLNMPHYQGQSKQNTERQLSRLSATNPNIKINEGLWHVRCHDGTKDGIDPSLGKPKITKPYKKYVKNNSYLQNDFFVNPAQHNERTIQLDQYLKQSHMINNEMRLQRIVDVVQKNKSVAIKGTSEAMKLEKLQKEKTAQSKKQGKSRDAALRFIRANPADPLNEQIELMAKTIQIESTFNESSLAGLD